jgi:hypothetical protein
MLNRDAKSSRRFSDELLTNHSTANNALLVHGGGPSTGLQWLAVVAQLNQWNPSALLVQSALNGGCHVVRKRRAALADRNSPSDHSASRCVYASLRKAMRLRDAVDVSEIDWTNQAIVICLRCREAAAGREAKRGNRSDAGMRSSRTQRRSIASNRDGIIYGPCSC